LKGSQALHQRGKKRQSDEQRSKWLSGAECETSEKSGVTSKCREAEEEYEERSVDERISLRVEVERDKLKAISRGGRRKKSFFEMSEGFR